MLLENKHVVVTGGTGSLGRTLVRRLMTGEIGLPSRVTVFSRDEAKQYEMRMSWLHLAEATDDVVYRCARDLVQFKIGDVRDYATVKQLVSDADVIFNTAALKQVPTCEYYPYEAVRTNVTGVHNIVRAVCESPSKPSLVVGISTDKACKPINVMGMTKALQERIFIQGNLYAPNTRFVCVRYGNVLASRGSVIPLFLDQIRRGGPVTITMKEMTRFLLSLDQAVDTVFAAVRSAEPGDTYIPRVPSANVVDIAKLLIGDSNIPIQYTGIRPGEKIHETLVSEEECFRTDQVGDYYVIRPMLPELRLQKAVEKPALDREFSSAYHCVDANELKAMLISGGFLDKDGVARDDSKLLGKLTAINSLSY
ncbi:MAG: polysaccharide biosynthesis protein [Deltaproteobacteria bacterium CG11_big_fil_rev_8_21_14_0_20_47_16]|nr:MAG: polysaccharide biosynthesis protein [Deltaproteobacteria bacterium CG11_big_fil_rev_8_21_14_0_20_47_16]